VREASRLPLDVHKVSLEVSRTTRDLRGNGCELGLGVRVRVKVGGRVMGEGKGEGEGEGEGEG